MKKILKKVAVETLCETETYKVLKELEKEIKSWYKFFKYASLIVTTGYFIYALCVGVGNIIVNSILAVMFAGYTIFDFATQNKKEYRNIKKSVKRSYKWSKLALNAVTIISMIYGIYAASTLVSPLTIIIATLMVVSWFVQVIFEALKIVVEYKIERIKECFINDWNNKKMFLGSMAKDFAVDVIKESADAVVDVIQKPVKFVGEKLGKKK
ncbi:MAG: hypothetical protein E7341_00355 [Clostridiales bacterium]|nr:hypothetical protein [Clostridiales bacterium]